MTPRGLWLRVLAGVGGAAAALALLDVPPPTRPGISPLLALSIGLGCGVALFIALARQLPPRPRAPGRSLSRVTFLVAWAAVEEILWRWLVLGGLATATGWPIALGVSSIAFAATHRWGRRSQLVTGTTFGLVYLATGRLLAAVATHAAYNLVLAEALARSRLRTRPA